MKELKAEIEEIKIIAKDAKALSEMAMNKVTAHETHCDSREKDYRDDHAELKDDIRGIYKLLWRGTIGTIVLLITICGSLITFSVIVGVKYLSKATGMTP